MNKLFTTDEKKKRWTDFCDLGKPDPHVFLINYNNRLPARPLPWKVNKKERIDWIMRQYQQDMEHSEWLADDRIPFLDMLGGTEIFAEAFGCRVFRPSDNMPFAIPFIHNAEEASKIKVPDLFSSTLAFQFEMADELKMLAGKDTILRLPDIQSPMDIVALIWDKSDLYLAMVDTPEAVKELACKVRQLMTSFLDEWFARYGKEFIAHFPYYYMPYGITLSEDEIGIVSPQMFEEFFLPELVELSKRYGAIGIHCCANSRHQWPGFKKIPSLKMLNMLHQSADNLEQFKFFAGHVAQYHPWNGPEKPWEWIKMLPQESRNVIEVNADSREEALELSYHLRELI